MSSSISVITDLAVFSLDGTELLKVLNTQRWRKYDQHVHICECNFRLINENNKKNYEKDPISIL